jgi:hypothetical protein
MHKTRAEERREGEGGEGGEAKSKGLFEFLLTTVI